MAREAPARKSPRLDERKHNGRGCCIKRTAAGKQKSDKVSRGRTEESEEGKGVIGRRWSAEAGDPVKIECIDRANESNRYLEIQTSAGTRVQFRSRGRHPVIIQIP